MRSTMRSTPQRRGRPELQGEAAFLGKPACGPSILSRRPRVERDDARADVERRQLEDPAGLATPRSSRLPPPMSTFITRADADERATAPEPWAASVASSPSPPLSDTNLPACAANRLADRAGVRAPHRTPVRSAPGVDRLGVDVREAILGLR